LLLGAVSVAISGAMQNFVAALTATGPTPPGPMWAQFCLTNAGAALIVVGRSEGIEPAVGVGGTAFLLGIGLLGAIVLRARRRALHLRHRVPLGMYEAAILCVLAGGAIGIALGTGAVGAASYLDLRNVHMVLNVLGWVSLTITGTLVTLLPTVLRVRMPAWSGRPTRWLFVAGVAVIATGLALGSTPVAATGGVVFVCAVAGLLTMVRRAISIARTWPVPTSARHLFIALAWFAAGAVWLAMALFRGVEWFAGAIDEFVLIFAGGWILQVLLGAWLFLLPMSRPGHPDQRRAELAAMKWGGTLQLAALNAGLAMLAIAASIDGASALAAAGATLALVGSGLALVKAWAFPILGRSAALTHRGRRVWDPGARPAASQGTAGVEDERSGTQR
jgi:nitrite reductase (NO-forming)